MMFASIFHIMRAFEVWQIEQLERIGKTTPARLEEFLQTVWNRYPALYEELAINAVDQNALTLDAAASRLGLTLEEVKARLDHLHETGDHRIHIINNVARLVSCDVAVWEVSREYANSGSLELLSKTFPGIPMSELRAALRYCDAHRGEIEAQISEFEIAYAKRCNLQVL
jgi:uncharacterized protein (DUF433 family)